MYGIMTNSNWMEFNEDSGDKVDVIFIVELSSKKKQRQLFPLVTFLAPGRLENCLFHGRRHPHRISCFLNFASVRTWVSFLKPPKNLDRKCFLVICHLNQVRSHLYPFPLYGVQ